MTKDPQIAASGGHVSHERERTLIRSFRDEIPWTPCGNDACEDLMKRAFELADLTSALLDSEEEWQRRGDRAIRAERALRRVLGLLSARRWWNHNAWAADRVSLIQRETLTNVSGRELGA